MGVTHMMHAVLRAAVLCACLCSTLISLKGFAEETASTVNKSSVTAKEYLGPRPDVISDTKSTAPKKRKVGEGESSLLDSVLRWNSIAIDASGMDHTPVQPGEDRVFGEAVGPGRSSRAMAIVHVAMFEALVSIHGGYKSYVRVQHMAKPELASDQAAVAQAAHDTLIAMFPSQRATFDHELETSMSQIPASPARKLGRRI